MEKTRINEAQLLDLENRIAYKFMNKGLLLEALVHSSYSNENLDFKNKHNERLEFLGDAVLELLISEYLYKNYKHVNEGVLTKYRSKIVCEGSFAKISDFFRLTDFLLLGKGESNTGGRNKDSIKADTFEALCGAIYLDGGLDSIKKVISRIIPIIESGIEDEADVFIDYKSSLQEYFHKQSISEFKYILCKEEGLAHNKTFYIDVYLNSKVVGSGKGKNKKMAEQMAAKDALITFGVLND